MLALHNWPVDRSILSFNFLNIWHFLASGGMWVQGIWDICEEVIFVPYDSVTDIESFPSGWILWHHWLKQRKWLVQPESDMVWCKVEGVT